MLELTFQGGVSIRLDAPESVAHAFEHLFGACRADGGPRSPDSRMTIAVMRGDSDGLWSVRFDGILAAQFDSLSQILPFLETTVCQFLLYHRADRLPLHAGAVRSERGAIVMPGEKGSGKSTLCLWLASRGWDYLGDELVWIDSEGRVEPFPKAAAIKEGSFELFGPAETFESLTRGPLRYHRPSGGGVAVGTALSVEALIFPQFDPNGDSVFQPLRPEETLLCLSQMVFGGMARRPDRFPNLVALAERPAWVAVYRDAREVEEWLARGGTR